MPETHFHLDGLIRAFVAFAALGLLAGCASLPNAQRSRFNEAPITREQIEQTGASSIHDVVRELRPGWLPFRQGSYIILADENRMTWDRINAGDDHEVWSEDPMFFEEWGLEDVLQLEWMRQSHARGFLHSPHHTNGFLGAIIIRYRS